MSSSVGRQPPIITRSSSSVVIVQGAGTTSTDAGEVDIEFLQFHYEADLLVPGVGSQYALHD